MASDAVCPKCEGTGFIIIERGGISGAEPCDCRAQGRTERLQDRSQIPPLYQNASFDNFVVPGVENPSARRELTTALLAVKTFERDFNGIVDLIRMRAFTYTPDGDGKGKEGDI